ncbi:MAG: DNA polymerase I [Acidimicrobiaceae bacterium]|nr:DNA polymerase I [Acidimicrobiaceae bacterium]MCY4279856.1 DNA polymerase I [Acidimicrobiaceae bacterium]MCY4294641.1 DNA polymerase I [Acidimicrobiaceae bacterium]
MARVMLIDGNSLAYRAFFALPTDMATASGQITNAVFGFTSMLINLWRDHEPEQVVVAFDRPEPTFRHARVPSYKATRDSAPDILRQQMGLVREVLDSLAVPTIDAAGYEADDVIATLATAGRDRGDDVIIVTGDRDAYQLVQDPHLKVLYNMRGVSEYKLYDEAGIRERTGVRPSDYVQYAALRGDSSDNLPGVDGVGEKTAAKLVNGKGSLDALFASLEDLTPKLRENLAAAEAQVRSNVELMTLVRDVPLEAGLEDLALGEVDAAAARKLFDFLELRTLYQRLAELPGDRLGLDGSADLEAPERALAPEVSRLDSPQQALRALRSAADDDSAAHALLALAVPAGGLEAGLAWTVDADGTAVAFLPGGLLEHAEVRAALAALVGTGAAGDSVRPIAVHDGKALMRPLLDLGVEMRDPLIDTMLAAYLLDPADARYKLSDVAERYADVEPPAHTAPEGRLNFEGETADCSQEASWAALAVARLVAPLREALSAQGLDHLNDEVEVPLVRVLARMEHAGIAVNRAVLERIRDELAAEADTLKQRVLQDAGRDINVNSPKQLAEVLFDDLQLTPTKRTKTGFSTDARSLEKLRGEHPIVEHLLSYREVEKLRSTYGVGLLAEVEPDDRIRATFNQTVARTGRLSSDAPNLHNIPVRSERGRVFRTAFVAPSGHKLLVADYDQIELRCIAHLAEDPGLIAAFEAGEDIHTATAARILGIDPSRVRLEERSTAKMVSYGLAYGMEAYGLAQRLNIATGEAAEILDAYFAAFPAVRDYMDATVAEARRRGYTETLFGRRRQIPELSSNNQRLRQAGERQAMNAGIQGLAADIFKVALVRLDRTLQTQGLASRIVLQVHDEIILEAPDSEIEEASALAGDVMRDAFELRVPLEVALHASDTWAGAKG